jgi:hypothetical protein
MKRHSKVSGLWANLLLEDEPASLSNLLKLSNNQGCRSLIVAVSLSESQFDSCCPDKTIIHNPCTYWGLYQKILESVKILKAVQSLHS